MDLELLKGAEGNVSAPYYFFSNAHNELYALYTGKGDLLKNF